MVADTVLIDTIRNAPCLGPGHVNTGLLRGVFICTQETMKHPECAAAAVTALLASSAVDLSQIKDTEAAFEAQATFLAEHLSPVPVQR